MIRPVWWDGARLVLLDQTRLPVEEVDRACATWQEVADAIRTLVVRGAPAIGVGGALRVGLPAPPSSAQPFSRPLAHLRSALQGLRAPPPPPVHPLWAPRRHPPPP